MADEKAHRRPPLLVALAGWLVPGAGYWLIGQRARALTVGITILGLFVLGLLVGGMRVVEAPNFAVGNPIGQLINQRPWFIGQVLAGPVSLVPVIVKASYASDVEASAIERGGSRGDAEADLRRRFPTSHARVAEIGTLYTAIAGMLNLLTIIDSAFRAGRGEEKK